VLNLQRVEVFFRKEKKFTKNSIRIRDIERGNVRKRLSLRFKTINDCIKPIESGIYPI